MSAPTATDLFCGAGGSSLGFELAGGKLRLGLNHWQRAIETHATNFQHADHDCEDVASLTTAQIRRYPDSDLLLASPECFAGGTLVLTELGWLPIEQVGIGVLVLTHLGRWREVVRTQARMASTVRVCGQGHTPGLKVTGNHRFWARSIGLHWNNQLRQYRRVPGEAQWITAEDLLDVQGYWSSPMGACSPPGGRRWRRSATSTRSSGSTRCSVRRLRSPGIACTSCSGSAGCAVRT